jgi:hypothetical protein
MNHVSLSLSGKPGLQYKPNESCTIINAEFTMDNIFPVEV